MQLWKWIKENSYKVELGGQKGELSHPSNPRQLQTQKRKVYLVYLTSHKVNR